MSALEKIPIPFEDFQSKLETNSKLLFSGIYGSGKTTFLNDFFDKTSDYESIHLYPVNYSVAANKDIFELIKYDILIQLLEKIPFDEFEKIEVPYELTAWHYLIGFQDIEKKVDFFSSFLNFGGTLGKGFLKVYEEVKHLIKGYRDYHNKLQSNDLIHIKTYLEDKASVKGHIYEEDLFTELIRIYVSHVTSRGQKLVLVVDDIDRLDPEHVFRVLNIFSANFDFRGEKNDNKFGFDKVILVADYSNLKSLYAHRYGNNSDFDGYLDKFYESIYWFSSSKFIKEIIRSFLRTRTLNSESVFDIRYSRIGSHIIYVLTEFLSYDLINFRDLIRYSSEYDFAKYDIPDTQAFHRTIFLHRDFVGLRVIRFLLDFFQNEDYFLDLIQKSKILEVGRGYDRHDAKSTDKICELLAIINHEKFSISDFERDKELILSYNNEDYCAKVVSDNYIISVRYDAENTEGSDNIENLRYFEVFDTTVRTYLDLTKKL